MTIYPEAASPRDLRSFGAIMATVLTLIGLWGVWRGDFTLSPIRGALLTVAGAFALAALLAPGVLREPRRLWMIVGERLGWIVSTVLLTAFFFAVITPVGLVRRAFRADSMGLRAAPEGESYWKPRPEETRSRERYEQQF